MSTPGPDHPADLHVGPVPGTDAGPAARDAPANVQGWALAPTPVVQRSDAHQPIAIADLRDEEHLAGLLGVLGSVERSIARAGGAILRHAIDAYVSVVLAPFAIDGVTAEIDPDHYGFDAGDNGEMQSVWVSRRAFRFGAHASPSAHGERAARLLLPIATALRVTARIGDRGSDLAIVDRLHGAARQLERSAHCSTESGWVDAFVDGLRIGNPRSIRTIAVQPDGGAPIDLPVSRVCCIGARRSTEDLCPMCPVFGDDATRNERALAWLASLDEQGFMRFVGRARM